MQSIHSTAFAVTLPMSHIDRTEKDPSMVPNVSHIFPLHHNEARLANANTSLTQHFLMSFHRCLLQNTLPLNPDSTTTVNEISLETLVSPSVKKISDPELHGYTHYSTINPAEHSSSKRSGPSNGLPWFSGDLATTPSDSSQNEDPAALHLHSMAPNINVLAQGPRSQQGHSLNRRLEYPEPATTSWLHANLATHQEAKHSYVYDGPAVDNDPEDVWAQYAHSESGCSSSSATLSDPVNPYSPKKLYPPSTWRNSSAISQSHLFHPAVHRPTLPLPIRPETQPWPRPTDPLGYDSETRSPYAIYTNPFEASSSDILASSVASQKRKPEQAASEISHALGPESSIYARGGIYPFPTSESFKRPRFAVHPTESHAIRLTSSCQPRPNSPPPMVYLGLSNNQFSDEEDEPQSETIEPSLLNCAHTDGSIEAASPESNSLPGWGMLCTVINLEDKTKYLCRNWKRHLSTIHGREEDEAVQRGDLLRARAVALDDPACQKQEYTCPLNDCNYYLQKGQRWHVGKWGRIDRDRERHSEKWHDVIHPSLHKPLPKPRRSKSKGLAPKEAPIPKQKSFKQPDNGGSCTKLSA
ncbi:hypothetical protein K439DRAFT_569358 [Ramaria rubella]|nr:hypothetical protein K439DRAFT_569358 [Ramaria rubella]